MTVWHFLVTAAALAFHLSGFVCALNAASRTHTAQGAAAWGLSLVAFPYLAVPLYLFIGPPKTGALAADQDAVRRAVIGHRGALPAVDTAPTEPADRYEVLARLSPLPITVSEPPVLLIDGQSVFGTMLEVIASARQTLSVGFYIIRDDALGQRFADALIERAQAGVEVRLMHDGIGSRNTDAAYWARLAEAGVEVRRFSISRRVPRILRVNYRNHRKLVVADGERATLGGPNVADEYFGPSQWFTNWRDTALQIEGPAAAMAETTFFEDWLFAGDGPADTPATHRRTVAPPQTPVPVLLLPTGPGDRLPVCQLAFLHLITAAKERFWLASPYFAPDLDILNALKLSAQRGVDVRIIVPKTPDHKLVWLAAFAFAGEVLGAGVKVFAYDAGFMHQKTCLVDDWAATVGTVNLDNRSLRLNFETTAVVFDQTFVRAAEAMFNADFSRSIPYDEEAHAARHPLIKFLAPGARLLSPML